VWERALEKDDKLAVALIRRAIAALGAGIASAINLLDLEAVVIGGGLGTRLGRPYADRIAQAMTPHLFVSERPPAVHATALGDLGGALGAALIAEPAPTASG
jgi:glucokinase